MFPKFCRPPAAESGKTQSAPVCPPLFPFFFVNSCISWRIPCYYSKSTFVSSCREASRCRRSHFQSGALRSWDKVIPCVFTVDLRQGNAPPFCPLFFSSLSLPKADERVNESQYSTVDIRSEPAGTLSGGWEPSDKSIFTHIWHRLKQPLLLS
ncbi:hypothetical protein LZ31DRAFT_251625 [Colletotrichum somersetense]|nr:hypothetical protein LZ31DRAFT_251625 [Colletotrichum somersetense]